MRRNGGEHLAGERTGHAFDLRVHFREIAADVPAENSAWQPRRTRFIGIGHRCMRMLFQLELVRPAIFNGITQAVQRTDAGIATPGKDQFGHTAHADELIVNEVRRHPDQSEPFAALPYDLVARSVRDQVREALERNCVAIANG